MKQKILTLLLFALTFSGFAQNKNVDVSFSVGTTMPIGNYAKEVRTSVSERFPTGANLTDFYGYEKTRKGSLQFNLDANYNFGKFGFGLSLGQFKHQVSDLKYDISMPTSFEGGDITGFYYGLGPYYKTNFGKIDLNFMARVGMMNLKYTDFSGFYNGTDVASPVEILTSTPALESKNALLYSSFGVQMNYKLSDKLSLFAKMDYLTALGNNFKINDTSYLPFDVNGNDVIDAFDVGHFTLIDYKREESRVLKPQMLNIGVGLTYVFGGEKGAVIEDERHSPFYGRSAEEKSQEDKGEGDNNMVLKSGSSSTNEQDLQSKIYAGTNGEFEITNDANSTGLYDFTTGVAFSGTGTAYLPFLASTVQVEFSNIKVDAQAHLTVGKIIVKSNPDEPTFPREWALSSIGSLTNFDHDKVQAIMDWADDQSNAVPALDFLGSNGPLQSVNNPAITTPFVMELDPNNDSRFAITEMVFLPTESKFNAVVAMDTPAEWNSMKQIGFIAKGVKFHTNDIVGPPDRAEIVSDILIGNANNDISFKFKSAADPVNLLHPGCYLEWDEAGFQQFGIEIEAAFTRNWFTPVPDDGTSKSTVTLLGQGSWGDLLLTGSFEKSKIVTAHNMTIEAANLNFDMSDSLNPVNISFPTAYQNLSSAQTDNTWRGFYAENVTIELPDDIETHQNGPVTIGVDNFIIDNQGLTMEAFANNIVQWPDANISDLNASIDTLSVKILTSSLTELQLKGRINIPASSVSTVQNPLEFVGQYIPSSQVANNAAIPQNLNITNDVLYLSVSPTGPIHSDLLKGKLELDPNSEIYVLKSDTLKYFNMNLQGKLKYESVNLGVVQDVDIEIDFQDLGFKYNTNSSNKFTFSPPMWSFASPQKKAHGFPLTINHIQYQSLPITGTEDLHGQLNFDMLLNLSGGSSNVSALAGLGVEFQIENDAVNDRRFKPSYITTHVDSLAVNAHLTAVDIQGNLFMQNNHPVYGKRIGGGLSAAFKGVDVSVQVEGEFGTTTYNHYNNKYRYWRVQANADFANGIPFISGLAFYGFKGGACNNMNLTLDNSDPTNIVQTYIPDYGNFGFKVGATIGTTPLVDSFNADIELEAIFSTTGNGMQYIGLDGNFGTNAKVVDRRSGKGKINGNFLVQYDFPNKHFYMGANATINASPITTPSPIWLAFDIDGLQNKWYFKCGEPDYSSNSPNNLLNTVNISLTGSSGLSLYEYFMFGNDLPQVGGFTYRFRDSYATAVGKSPGFGSNVSNLSSNPTTQLGSGIALGIGFKVDKTTDTHIKDSYYLSAGVNAGAEVNLSYMRYAGSCANYTPVGINGWRAKGSLGVYARAFAQVQRRNDHPKTWPIADLKGGAWMHGEFPNPYYVRGAVDGVAKAGCVTIRGKKKCLVNRSVHVDFEKGTNCTNSQNNSTPTYQQQYATDEFDNDLINHVAPSQNWNFPVDSPVAVKYNFEPDEVFHVSEQQANGSVVNRTFKMVNSVKFIKASSIVNNSPQFSNNTGVLMHATNMGLSHRVNDIGEYQYILESLLLSANTSGLNAAISNQQSNQGALQVNQGMPQQVNYAVVNPVGTINQQPTFSAAAINNNIAAMQPMTAFPTSPPYLNNLTLNSYYKFTVEATMKEYNYTTQQWEDALNTDGSVVREVYSKVFRTGPMPPLTAIYQDSSRTIFQNNISTH